MAQTQPHHLNGPIFENEVFRCPATATFEQPQDVQDGEHDGE
jgi:hypothetical protein